MRENKIRIGWILMYRGEQQERDTLQYQFDLASVSGSNCLNPVVNLSNSLFSVAQHVIL